jgi:hypothetical protein
MFERCKMGTAVIAIRDVARAGEQSMRPFCPGRTKPLQCAIARDLSHLRSSASPIGAVALCAVLALASPNASAGSTFFVTSTADSGPDTLRGAIAAANTADGNTVQIDSSLKGSTITLTSDYIEINHLMTVTGPGENAVTVSGGGISRIFYVHDTSLASDVTISNMTLTAGNVGVFSGGAIAAKNSRLVVDHVTISASSANDGGGIFMGSGNLQVRYSHITGNQAVDGGGIHTVASELRLDHDTISANTASAYGGGIFADASSPPQSIHVINSTISGNTIPDTGGPANQGGGGIAIRNSTVSSEIYLSTIAQNYGYGGAGIALLDAASAGVCFVLFSTISGNLSSESSGNGIAAASGGTVSVARSIVAGNSSRNGGSDLAGTFYLYRSLIQEPDSATITLASSGNLFLTGPQLGALGDHGGPTPTMLPATTSPAIDNGGTCSVLDFVFDQRGYQHCVNDKWDIGAVERQNPENIIFRNGFAST